MDGSIDRVARDRRQHIVEGDVGTLEPFEIASRRDVRIHHGEVTRQLLSFGHLYLQTRLELVFNYQAAIIATQHFRH